MQKTGIPVSYTHLDVYKRQAYGYLKSEKGVHRLVLISPFNAAGKRQTSFVSCDVMPDIEEDLDIEVKDEDIRIDTYRSCLLYTSVIILSLRMKAD